jgi:hypothetical protein
MSEEEAMQWAYLESLRDHQAAPPTVQARADVADEGGWSTVKPKAEGGRTAVKVKTKEGDDGADWLCGKCMTVNFSRRDVCFTCSAMREGNEKPASKEEIHALSQQRMQIAKQRTSQAPAHTQTQTFQPLGQGACAVWINDPERFQVISLLAVSILPTHAVLLAVLVLHLAH